MNPTKDTIPFQGNEDTNLFKMIDDAAELKLKESEMAKERADLELQIATAAKQHLTSDKKSVKLSGTHFQVTVQFKDKENWDQGICMDVAEILGHDTFHELFNVSFKGRKKPILSFMATTANEAARKLLSQACKSEPGKPYLSYTEVQ